MDEYYNVKRLALVLAVQAEIEGMKTANNIAEHKNKIPPYGEEDFNRKANQMNDLAHAHNKQL